MSTAPSLQPQRVEEETTTGHEVPRNPSEPRGGAPAKKRRLPPAPRTWTKYQVPEGSPKPDSVNLALCPGQTSAVLVTVMKLNSVFVPSEEVRHMKHITAHDMRCSMSGLITEEALSIGMYGPDKTVVKWLHTETDSAGLGARQTKVTEKLLMMMEKRKLDRLW